MVLSLALCAHRVMGTWYSDAMEDSGKENFFDRVYGVVARIPRGKVVSYGQIAALLGNPRAARSVGWALSACPDGLPWQRVVKADGSITGGAYAELRRELLMQEGIEFQLDGRVDMKACAWRP